MSRAGLQAAGWIAAIGAVLTAPLFAFQVLAARSGPTHLSTAVQIVNVLLLLYVLASLRALLAQKKIETAGTCLAAILVVSVALQFCALIATPDDPVVALSLLCCLITLGVLYIVTGIKLLAAAATVPGLKLFCCAAIAVGICLASVVLALATLPASMVMDVALAIVFFREAGSMATPAKTGV